MSDSAAVPGHDAGFRRLGWAALPVAVVLALTACGPGRTTPGTGGFDGPSGAMDGVGRVGPPPSAADVLAKWQSFPVTADPRPLILTTGAVLDPATGFRTDDDKVAYGAGHFEFATTVPAAPATSAGYAIVSAKAALGRLRPTGTSQPSTRPLRIVKISLVQATFGTDRGQRALPAWRFQLDQVADPVQVLAVDSKQLWRPTGWGSTGMDHRASLSGNGRSLQFSFYGSPPECVADYTADVAESGTAVVVTPRDITPNPQGSASVRTCPAIAAQRTVTVKLAAPLGARVLLTPEGSPVPVSNAE